MNENLRHWKRRLEFLLLAGIIFVIFIIFIIELKHEYNINILPDVNGRLDDIYYEIKNKIFKD